MGWHAYNMGCLSEPSQSVCCLSPPLYTSRTHPERQFKLLSHLVFHLHSRLMARVWYSAESAHETMLVKPNTISVNSLVFKSISASYGFISTLHQLISDFSSVIDFWLLLSFLDQHLIYLFFIFLALPKWIGQANTRDCSPRRGYKDF